MKEQGPEKERAVKIGRIVERFNNARRRGRRPSIDEWVEKYASADAPADQLRQQLEMSLVILESAKTPWPGQEIPAETEQNIKQKLLSSFSSKGAGHNEIEIIDIPHPITRECGGVPVVSLAAAGPGQEFDLDALLSEEGWEKVTRPFDMPGKDVFAVKVKGNSMEPTIPVGSVVLIDPKKEVYSGCLALIITRDYHIMLKRARFKDGKVILISANPEYPPQELAKTEIRRMYKVAWIKMK